MALVATSAFTAATLWLLLGLGRLIDVEVSKLEPNGRDVPMVLLPIRLLELANECSPGTGHDLGTSDKTSLDRHRDLAREVGVADDELCVCQRVSHPSVVKCANADAFKNTL